jgi:O-antigen/teichoic acid export membrane protein
LFAERYAFCYILFFPSIDRFFELIYCKIRKIAGGTILMFGLHRNLPSNQSMFFQSSLFKDMWILTLGNSIGQIALLAVMPFASRLYSPSDYGALALYTSVLLTGVSLAGLAYHQAIPVPSKDGDGTALLILSLFIEILLIGTVSGVVWIGTRFVPPLAFLGTFPISFWLFPLGILWAGIYKILISWCTRAGRFTELALSKGVQGIGSAFVTVAMGMAGFRPLGLIAGYIVSQSLGVVYILQKTISFRQVQAASPLRLLHVAKKYRRFPLYNTWSDLMNTLSSQLTPIILASLYDPRTTGFFALSFQVINLPMQFIGMAIQQVFFQKASQAYYHNSLDELTRSTFALLVRIGFLPFLYLTLVGPELFAFLFGERWHMAGIYTQWMSPWLFTVFCVAPLYSILYILERQKQNTLFQAFILLSRVGALYFGAWCGGALWSIALFGGVGLVLWIFLLTWIMCLSGNIPTAAAEILFREAKRCAPVVVALLIVKFSFQSYGVITLLSLLCVAAFAFHSFERKEHSLKT